MSEKSCSACNDLREYAPEFVVNGVTDNVAANLEDNNGLSAAAGHTDCEDLLDVNDCLIGNMIDELDGYEVCDWKDYMSAFLGNLYETIKAMVYSQCGQWCAINGLYNGANFVFTENTSGNAYAVAGKGVSFLLPHAGQIYTSDLHFNYIAGGLVLGGGSCQFFTSNFTDAGSCMNFDDGSTTKTSQSRSGNSVWVRANAEDFGNDAIPFGGELIYELRLNLAAYPEVGSIFPGFGMETHAGEYHVQSYVFNAGQYAFGQHGRCKGDGTKGSQYYDDGHLVPAGWVYIQLRMSGARNFGGESGGQQYSPQYFLGIRMNQDKVKC